MLYLLKFVSISSQQPSTQRSEARGGMQPRPRLPSRLIQHTQFFFCLITGDSKELFRLATTLSAGNCMLYLLMYLSISSQHTMQRGAWRHATAATAALAVNPTYTVLLLFDYW